MANETYYGGIYSGVKYNFHRVDHTDVGKSFSGHTFTWSDFESNITALNSAIETYLNTHHSYEGVVGLVYVPSYYFRPPQSTDEGYSQGDEYKPVNKTFNLRVPSQVGFGATLITPRNKKLLTYPYTLMSVKTPEVSQPLRFEFFRQFPDGQDPTIKYVSFKISGAPSVTPELVCEPLAYEGYDYSGGFNVANPMYGIKLGGFPQVAFPIDSFKAWIAQGGAISFAEQIASGVASVAVGGATMGVAGNAVTEARGMATSVGGGMGLASSIAEVVRLAQKGNVLGGTQNGSIYTSIREKDFYFETMSIHPEYARKIDDYFDRYGYATNTLKVPYRHARKAYTYTKTKDCIIAGGCPADDARKISDIFNKGITFWANPYAVGVYKSSAGVYVDNAPLGNSAT